MKLKVQDLTNIKIDIRKYLKVDEDGKIVVLGEELDTVIFDTEKDKTLEEMIKEQSECESL